MKHNVIIIGAGPVGLGLASALAGLNLDIAIIEKQSNTALADPAFDGRDIALTHRSVRLLKELRVWSRIPSASISPIKEARVLDGVSPFYMKFDHRKTDQKELGYLVSNHLIRKALYDEVITKANNHLITQKTVRDISINREKGSVLLSDGKRLEACLIVAADSRLSEIRRKAGISAMLRDFGHNVIVCRMEHEKPHQNIAYECFQYGRTLAVLPLSGNQSSIVITAAPGKCNELLGMDADQFNDDVQRHFEHRLGEMKLISERHQYPLVAVYSDRFVSERFALVGDAAVGMHPVTAHGYNLGLRGQDILVKEIKSALIRGTDIGSSMVLENYQSKHRQVTRPLYMATNGIVRLYTNDLFPARIMRKAILRFGNNIWPIKRAVLNQLTEIDN